MKFNKVVTFLSFAWLPVAAMLVLGAEANAMTGVDARYVSDAHSGHSDANTALSKRFSPTRYGYPSDLLGKEVPLVYGAYQGRASLPGHDREGGLHELIISAHDQGDLDRDGRNEAIVLVEESLCSRSSCTTSRHLDIWGTQGGDIVRKGRIPISTEMEIESVGIQIRQHTILLSMVDLDAAGELREVSERWKMSPYAPILVETRLGDVVDDADGGC